MQKAAKALPRLEIRVRTTDVSWRWVLASGASRPTWLPNHLAALVLRLVELNAIAPEGAPVLLGLVQSRLPSRVQTATLREYARTLTAYGLTVAVDVRSTAPRIRLVPVAVDGQFATVDLAFVDLTAQDWWRARKLDAQRAGRAGLVGGQAEDELLSRLDLALRESDWSQAAAVLSDEHLSADWIRSRLSTTTRDRVRPLVAERRAAYEMQFGEPKDALKASRVAVQAFQRTGNVDRLAATLGVQTAIWQMLGDDAAAISTTDAARELVLTNPNTVSAPTRAAVLASTAHHRLRVGDVTAGLRQVEEGLAAAEHVGDPVRRLEARIRFVELALKVGDFGVAERVLEDLRPVLDATPVARWVDGWWWRFRVQLLVARKASVEEVAPIFERAWAVNLAGRWRYQLQLLEVLRVLET